MKRNVFVKRILCVLLALCCVTASVEVSKVETQAAASLSTMVKQLKAGKFKKAIATAKKLPKKANEKCVKKMSSKMKKAYQKKVNALKKNHTNGRYVWGYYLTDINNDGKAELLVQYGSCEADVRMLVFQYTNKAKRIGEFWSDHATFGYYSNGILMLRQHMGHETVSQVYFKKGKLKEKVISDRQVMYGEADMVLPYQLRGGLKLK